MRIAHLCLSCFYVDGRGYQENFLVRQHIHQGHDVLVVASTETHDADGKITYTSPSRYLGTDGAQVIRLPYQKWLPQPAMRKLRMHSGLRRVLEDFRPNAILFHGTCGWELLNAADYVREHSDVLFYVDSHEDYHNSARTTISRNILHRQYYARVLRHVLPRVRKILCVSTEAIDFVETMYRIPRERLEFFPLGGLPVAPNEYVERRERTRRQLGLTGEQIVIIQAGKQTERKRLVESLQAFGRVTEPRMRFLIAGTLSDSIKPQVEHLIASDQRVRFLGWQETDRLTDLLCASDVYLQPGTQSVTMQHSLCCHCAVILADTPAHVPYFQRNGWLVDSFPQLENALREIGDSDLYSMKENSYSVARELIDYNVLSQRVLQ